MEIFLTNQELHEFAQWFAFHYGGGIGGSKEQNKYPREDVIDFVEAFIESKFPEKGDTNIGFIKWFAEKYKIYGDCKGRSYQKFCEATNWDTTIHLSKTTQEWIDQHFEGGNVTDGLLYDYFQDKIKGDFFKTKNIQELIVEINNNAVKFIDTEGNLIKKNN